MSLPLRAGRRLILFCVLPAALAATASCSPTVDLKQTLQVTDINGGWYDAGIVDGKNKLVPTISFRVRKPADVKLRSLSLNVIFKRVSADKKEEEDLDEVFLQTVEFSEGNATPLLTVRPEHGYTGDAPQTRAEILQHSQFKDARAVVFAKQSSTTWVDLLRQDIPRVLLPK
ncbi:MAG TPA: hypothetical protein VFJ02_09630 [Vicinamibacterales bacterium]|nr:hypothetical protein [Vicinamibacterales bacterium]